MRAVTVTGPGGLDVLGWGHTADPEPAAGEVLIDIAASAVNRADLLQRQGFYPPPPGAPDIMAWSEAAVMVARLAAGESVLVHGGSSGIGTMAIQVARALGARSVACTVGSDAKARAVRDLGADTVVTS
jgi:NADPH:quinone reductase-like Zn-dependent oxidoreductase